MGDLTGQNLIINSSLHMFRIQFKIIQKQMLKDSSNAREKISLLFRLIYDEYES